MYTGPTLADFSDDHPNLSNRTETKAFYLFNTAEFNDRWSLNLGVRGSAGLP